MSCSKFSLFHFKWSRLNSEWREKSFKNKNDWTWADKYKSRDPDDGLLFLLLPRLDVLYHGWDFLTADSFKTRPVTQSSPFTGIRGHVLLLTSHGTKRKTLTVQSVSEKWTRWLFWKVSERFLTHALRFRDKKSRLSFLFYFSADSLCRVVRRRYLS